MIDVAPVSLSEDRTLLCVSVDLTFVLQALIVFVLLCVGPSARVLVPRSRVESRSDLGSCQFFLFHLWLCVCCGPTVEVGDDLFAPRGQSQSNVRHVTHFTISNSEHRRRTENALLGVLSQTECPAYSQSVVILTGSTGRILFVL